MILRKYFLKALVLYILMFNTLGYAADNQLKEPPCPSSVITTWYDLLLIIIEQSPGFTPPVTARSLSYINLGVYETLKPFYPEYVSMDGQLSGFKVRPEFKMPLPQEDYFLPAAVNSTMWSLIDKFYEPTLYTSMTKVWRLRDSLNTIYGRQIAPDVLERSNNLGLAMADEIFEYSKSDGGHQAFIRPYNLDFKMPVCDSCYVINVIADLENTGPLHPFWGKNRLFNAESSKLMVYPKVPFSDKPGSAFYNQAKEMYDITKSIRRLSEKYVIANYWDDAANATFTPAGHSFNILQTITKQRKLELMEAAAIYLKLGLAVNDAFIVCWKAKYLHNLIRPYTYIKRNIDPDFEPMLLTPPFPEFPSGHSTQSGAFTTILTAEFGDNYPFSDFSKYGFGEKRYYPSFNAAANEASMSRIYAGIHFKDACDQGLDLGKKVAENILKFKFKR